MREALKHQILRYLVEHPSARDSVEGIHAWWLRPEDDAMRPEVEEALADLVGRGWLETYGEGTSQLYGLLVAATPEIREYLMEGQPGG
jgi:hypothetical protein